MRLSVQEASLFAGAWRELDARLLRETDDPVAVALSGGGDSVALLRLATAWGRQAVRPIVALTVNHGLQAASADWARWCAGLCERMGVRHFALQWTSPRPGPVAARRARHILLSEAARASGARIILMGHTADDVIEARLMRQAGARVTDPRPVSPSPVWPEGRDVHLLRPLLGVRRADLREALQAAGQAWIDDPANDDPAFGRARARAKAAGLPDEAPDGRSADVRAASPFRCGPAGELVAATDALLSASPTVASLWLGAAVACAAGLERLPRREAVDRRLAAIRSQPSRATLGGARLDADARRVLAVREIGRQDPEAPIALPPGKSVVFQGRFELVARSAGMAVATLAGRSSRLDRAQAQRVRRLDPFARPMLPAVLQADGAMRLPTLEPCDDIVVRGLVAARLEGACGTIDHESAIVTWRSPCKSPKSAA